MNLSCAEALALWLIRDEYEHDCRPDEFEGETLMSLRDKGMIEFKTVVILVATEAGKQWEGDWE